MTGIFPLCDEQLKLPKASDDRLTQSYYDKCGMHKYFSASKFEKANIRFTIKHFAGEVHYSAVGFLDKNRSEIAKELVDCMFQSNKSLVQIIVSNDVYEERASVSAQYCKQLQKLVTRISNTRAHFIRCIKPNHKLKPQSFDAPVVMHQLRCGGALEAVKVFRAGFPNRVDYETFVTRYMSFSCVTGMNGLTRDFNALISIARRTGTRMIWRMAASTLINMVPLTESIIRLIECRPLPSDVSVIDGLQMGKSQVFLRAPVHDYLEILRLYSLGQSVARIQCWYRIQNNIRKNNRLQSCGGKRLAIEMVLFLLNYKFNKIYKKYTAMVLLQRRLLVFLEVLRRKRVIRGVILLQGRVRGFIIRHVSVPSIQMSVIRIQTWYRARKQYRIYSALIQNILAKRDGSYHRNKIFNVYITFSKLFIFIFMLYLCNLDII